MSLMGFRKKRLRCLRCPFLCMGTLGILGGEIGV